MIGNYLRLVLRIIKRQKGYFFINILGLAVGMACCILILLWVQDEINYDRFHKNLNELHMIGQIQDYSGRQVIVPATPSALGPALKKEYPEITHSTRYSKITHMFFAYGDKKIYETKGAYTEPDFLKMFSFPLLKGDIDTVLSGPNSIVISETLAKKYFPGEEPLGKTLQLDENYEVTVTGVLKDVPHNSTLQFQFLLPFEHLKVLGRDLNAWNPNLYMTFILTTPNVPYQEVEQKIAQRLKREAPDSQGVIFLHPMARIHLHSTMWRLGTDIQYIRIFTLVAFFVLIIACINFMNLSTARSFKRAKEVGLRKVAGAHRSQLIKQFYSESLVMTLLSLVAAIILVLTFLPSFNTLTGKQLTSSLFSPGTLLILLIITAITTILAGSYPALLLSSFQPVKVIKEAAGTGKKSTWFRNFLVVFQFSLAIGLTICTLIVFNQLKYIQNKNLGFSTKNILYLSLQGVEKQYEAMKTELLKNPRIKYVTCSSHIPLDISTSSGSWSWEGKSPNEKVMMCLASFEYDFIQTFDMKMAQGRFYSEDFPSDADNAVVVNEEAIKAMNMESPLGKRFVYGPNEFTIIGVVQNFHFKSLHEKIEPFVILFAPSWRAYMFMKITPEELPATISYVGQIYNKFNPGKPFEYKFLEDDFRAQYQAEAQMGQLFKYFVFLAIFISCMGLFALASYMTERRTREIGIRKVVGASVPSILFMLFKDSGKWVLVANIIAWPTAYIAMSKWLQNFVYRISPSLAYFILAALFAIVIALATISYQSLKAALANPVKAIKYE